MGILYELKAFPKLVAVQQRLARVKLPQKIIRNGIWQKDDDCVITCVRRITEKERNRQEAILEANVVDSHSWFTRPFTKE